MPTILAHAAVPLALRWSAGERRISNRLWAAATCASALPDADVVGFVLGIPYGDTFGHRGFSHSLSCAAAVGLIGSLAARRLHATRAATFVMLFVSMASHGLLDAATDGGLGVAFLSPFSNERFFLPWRPIRVSPIGLSRFLSARGLVVLSSEVLWIWVPVLALAGLTVLVRRFTRTRPHM